MNTSMSRMPRAWPKSHANSSMRFSIDVYPSIVLSRKPLRTRRARASYAGSYPFVISTSWLCCLNSGRGTVRRMDIVGWPRWDSLIERKQQPKRNRSLARTAVDKRGGESPNLKQKEHLLNLIERERGSVGSDGQRKCS
jgi:hypothetical protein